MKISCNLLAAGAASLLLVACKPAETQQAQVQPMAAPVPAPPSKSLKVIHPGPFGTQQGMTLKELETTIALTKSKEFFYTSGDAPAPNGDFTAYGYWITPEHGLCKVTGISDAIKTNVFGEQLRDKYGAVKGALVEKYAKPSFDKDYVERGSIWTDPQDFMAGLQKQDRALGASWYAHGPDIPAKRSVKLPPGLSMIELDAMADGHSDGKLVLAYSFENNDKCLEVMKAAKNKSL
ncbi:hypothetical protein [Polaromonas sp.]|uniref:hypothetical protein n=1 Tax=Polaromonas sp. TaxID=1869339 RepID=UPI00375322A6